MRMKELSILIVILSILFIIISCEDEKKDETKPVATISGSISLEADSLAGIQIGIVSSPAVEEELLTALSTYSQVGFPLTLGNTFDHRQHSFELTTETDELGNFVISDVPHGTYTVVALHPDYGFAYRHNVVVDSDQDHSIGDPIQLYPVTYLNGIVAQEITFETGHHYIVGSDGEDVTLAMGIFEPGAVIRIATQGNMNIYGMRVETSDTYNPYWFTSNDMFDSFEGCGVNEPAPFNRIGMYGQNELTIPLKGGRISYSTDGITCHYYTLQIQEFQFDSSLHGFVLETSSTAFIQFENCIFSNCSIWSDIDNGYNGQGIRVNSDENIDTKISISNCLFYKNEEGARLKFTYGDIANNYFYGNYIGFRGVRSKHYVNHSCFDMNSIGASLCASRDTLMYNDFEDDDYNVELNFYYVQGSSFEHCYPKIQKNNFMCESNKTISSLGLHPLPDSWHIAGQGIDHDYEFPNNYFKTSDIDTSIIDYYDAALNDDLQYLVIYLPKSAWAIDEAGIQ